MPLARLFRRNDKRDAAYRLYTRIVEQARQPVFFAERGVPDTLDGRFELIALHAFLVLNRLKAERAETADFAQDLFDAMFADLDRALREIGVGDLSVGKHVKQMAAGFFGRILAYEKGLAEGGGEAAPMLDEALRRNLYGTVERPDAADIAAMAEYVRRAAADLTAQPVSSLLAGTAEFPSLPTRRGRSDDRNDA
jgi:cytochrome b pre-mRNA-processing protein 3